MYLDTTLNAIQLLIGCHYGYVYVILLFVKSSSVFSGVGVQIPPHYTYCCTYIVWAGVSWVPSHEDVLTEPYVHV